MELCFSFYIKRENEIQTQVKSQFKINNEMTIIVDRKEDRRKVGSLTEK